MFAGKMIHAAVALTLGMTAAPAAFAGSYPLEGATAADARTRTVRFADLDLANREGAATLERRIRYAVGKVCGSADHRDLAAQYALSECRDAAMADANRQVAAVTAKTQLAQRGDVSGR